MPLPPDVCQTFLPCWQKARLPHKNAFTKPAHLIACFRPRKWSAGWNGFSYRERYLPNTSLRRSRSVSAGVVHGACCGVGSSSVGKGGGFHPRVILCELWRGTRGLRPYTVKADRTTRGSHARTIAAHHILQKAQGLDPVMLEQFGPGHDRRTPVVHRNQSVQPVLRRLRLEVLAENILDGVTPGEPAIALQIRLQRSAIERLGQRCHRAHCQRQITIRRGVNTVWCAQVR